MVALAVVSHGFLVVHRHGVVVILFDLDSSSTRPRLHIKLMHRHSVFGEKLSRLRLLSRCLSPMIYLAPQRRRVISAVIDTDVEALPDSRGAACPSMRVRPR